jgi:hypothetical protein
MDPTATLNASEDCLFSVELTSIPFLKSTCTRSESEQPPRIALARKTAVKREAKFCFWKKILVAWKASYRLRIHRIGQ